MVCGTSMGGMEASGLSLDKGIDEVISYVARNLFQIQ